MPGFRPGMVPAGLVKKMYGKGILADVLNKKVGDIVEIKIPRGTIKLRIDNISI